MTTRIQLVPGPWAVPDNWPTHRIVGRVAYSDGFGGSSETLLGRTADAGQGGEPFTWSGTAGIDALKTDGSGRLVGSDTPANGFYAMPTPGPNYEISARFLSVPTGQAIYLDARRQAIATSGSYRAQVTPDGTVRLQYRAPNLAVTTLTEIFGFTVGEIGLRVEGDQISILINGEIVHTATDSGLSAQGYAGIATVSTITSVMIDHVKIMDRGA